MHKIVLLISVALICFLAGWLVRGQRPTEVPKPKPWEQALAFPEWSVRECVAATPQEQDAFDLAISSLEVAGQNRDVSWLDIGAEKFLSAGITRRDTPGWVPVCAPDGIYERAANAITEYQLFSRGRLEEYELQLAAKLPVRSQHIISAIENSAFNKDPQESEIFTHRDIRPFARTVLASFGKDAAAYGDIAYQEMTGDNSLGTGAAQVAAAAGYRDTLQRIQAIMEHTLSTVPKDTVVPLDTKNRLYELSYAIYFGGEDAKNYTAPIKDLMTRKVQGWAHEFGMLELDPIEMCEVLKRIGGPASIAGYEFCAESKVLRGQ